jgi:predicted transcriptional regulator
MEARRQGSAQPFSYYWNIVKTMDDSQKLQLIALLAESIMPARANAKEADDEEYALRPFTKEELTARIDQAEAEIAAGLGTPHEEVMREMDEEIERWEQEDLKLEMASAV